MAFCRKPALSTRLVSSWLNNCATGSRIPIPAATAAGPAGQEQENEHQERQQVLNAAGGNRESAPGCLQRKDININEPM